jgi:hypothetical protein
MKDANGLSFWLSRPIDQFLAVVLRPNNIRDLRGDEEIIENIPRYIELFSGMYSRAQG